MDIQKVTDRDIQNWTFEYLGLRGNTSKDLVEVGYVLPIYNGDFVDYVMKLWVDKQDGIIDEIEKTGDVFETVKAKARRGFTLAEYTLVLSSKIPPDRYDNFRVFDYLYIIDKDSESFFISGQTPNEEDVLEGFLRAIQKIIENDIPQLHEFFFANKIKQFFPIASLKRHAYILAGTGGGKSELIKYLFYRLQERSHNDNSNSLVLIEPHGDLATQVLQFSLNFGKGRDRVIYLDPFLRETAKLLTGEDILKKDYTFVLNPFDIKTKSSREINYMTQELSSAFFEILKSDSTVQMKAIIQACVDTLLRMEGTSVADLKRFMDDNQNEDLVQRGRQNPNIERKALMERFLEDSKISPTKSGIYYRLQSLIDDMELRRLLVGETTVKLEKELNSGKVIIFNLSKGLLGKESAPAFGKLVIALIQGIARKRQLIPEKMRKPTYVFVDEMQNYVTETIDEIMTESRKYALHMILANQVLGQNMSTALRKIILSNTAIKIAGENEEDSLKVMGKAMGNLKPEAFNKLPKFHFYSYDKLKKEVGANVIKAPNTLIDVKPPLYMDKEQLKEFFVWLAEDSGYYIKVSGEGKTARSNAGSERPTSDKNTGNIYKPNFDD